MSANGILMMYSDDIPEDQRLSIPSVARVVRASIKTGRDPAFVETWVSFASFLMSKSANAQRYQWFAPEDQEATVNSNYRRVPSLRLKWHCYNFGI